MTTWYCPEVKIEINMKHFHVTGRFPPAVPPGLDDGPPSSDDSCGSSDGPGPGPQGPAAFKKPAAGPNMTMHQTGSKKDKKTKSKKEKKTKSKKEKKPKKNKKDKKQGNKRKTKKQKSKI